MLKKWMSEDGRVIEIIGGSEMIMKSVSLLRKKTKEDKEEGEEEEGEEEGICVSEKNGILGIVLEVVEGGGWKGDMKELEEVVGRLEEEGKKRWKEKRGEKGGRGGIEWREMGRLAHEVGWAIEERKGMGEGRGGDGEMLTLLGMKKKAEEKDKQLEEERKGREEMEERVRNLEGLVDEMKYRPIASLDGTSVIFRPSTDGIKKEGNTITHHGSDSCRNCFIGGEMTSV